MNPEHTANDIFNFNLLPTELLVEIFTYLEHNDRLEMALVCKRWSKVARSQRFDLNLKEIKDSSEFHDFLNTFKEHSLSLPIKCINIQSEIFEDVLPAKVNLFNELFIKHSTVEVEVETNVKLSGFVNVVEMIPITVKKVNWIIPKLFFYVVSKDYEEHWISICNAVKCKEIKVVMSFQCSSCYREGKLKMFEVMSKNPLKNITLNGVSLDEDDLNLFSDEGKFDCLKTCKELQCDVTKPYHLKIINYVGKNNLTKLSLYLEETENFMEYLSDLQNLEELIVNNSSPIIIFTRKVLSFPQLRMIRIFDIGTTMNYDHESFKRFLRSCPNLVDFCGSFRSVERKKLLDFIESICQEFPLLKKLNINCFPHHRFQLDEVLKWSNFTFFDDLFVHVKALKNLEELSTATYSIKDFTILKELQFNNLKELRCQFFSITEKDAQMLVDACQNLEILSLRGIYSIKTNRISVKCIKIFSQLQRLKDISLLYCYPNERQLCVNILKQNNPSLKVAVFDIN